MATAVENLLSFDVRETLPRKGLGGRPPRSRALGADRRPLLHFTRIGSGAYGTVYRATPLGRRARRWR